MKFFHCCLLVALFVHFAAPSTAQGLIAYEPFEDMFTGFSVAGQGSGFGWGDWDGAFFDDTWVLHKNSGADFGQSSIEDGGLSYTDSGGNILTVAGNQKLRAAGAAGVEARVFRPIAGTGPNSTLSDLAGGTGNSYYISFIGKREGQTDAEYHGTDPTPENPYSRFAHFGLYGQPQVTENPTKPGEQAIVGNTFVTDDNNHWAFSGLDAQLDTGVTYGGDDQRFVVLKVSIGGGTNGADFVEMWIDPVLTSELDANGTNVAKVMANYAEVENEVVPADGDFNDDNVVNLADYALWRNNLGAPEGTLPNVGGLVGSIGVDHYNLWKSNFGAEGGEMEIVDPSNFTQAAIGIGAGNDSSSRAPGEMIVDEIRIGLTWGSVTPHTAAGAAIAGARVPEPSSLLLMACGSAALMGMRIRRCYTAAD